MINLARSKKEIILINAVLSFMIIVILSFGYIYPAYQNQQALMTKLIKLQREVTIKPLSNNERIINFTELFKALKAEPFSEIRILSSSQEQGYELLSLSGPLPALHALVNLLGASTLVEAKLRRTNSVYELSLSLKDLRLNNNGPLNVPELKTPTVKLVGQVHDAHHHYCVFEDGHRHIKLREQTTC